MFYLGFAREMFKRYSLISCVSGGNKILCHGQYYQQAVSSVGLLYNSAFSGSDNVVRSAGMVSDQ